MKTKLNFILTIVMIMAVSAASYAVLPDKRGPTEVVAPENKPEFVELYRITFENKRGGAITAEKNGVSQRIGTVLASANKVNAQGYTASGWATPGTISATAVNACHVKVTLSKQGRGVIFSFLPKEMFGDPEKYSELYKASSSIITDMPGGTGFFGGGWSPYIDSKVYFQRGGGGSAPIPEDYAPTEGDFVQVRVEKPARYPASITFENRFGGRVILAYPDGKEKTIAMVLKPVYGVGRFSGSEFADVGRIRANHTGVVCVSTSPMHQIGGFQIIPDNHGMSTEMTNARILTQWMVVGPTSVDDPSTEGVAPLFRYFIQPVYYSIGPKGRTIEQMLDMFIVQVRLGDGDWQRMPQFTGRDDTALKDLTAVRILFPLDADFLRGE